MTQWTTTTTRPLVQSVPIPEYVEGSTPSDRDTVHTASQIAAAICGVKLDELERRGRTGDVKEARHIMRYALWLCLGWSLKRIGRATNYDHTTILHSVQVCKNRIMTKDPSANLIKAVVSAMHTKST